MKIILPIKNLSTEKCGQKNNDNNNDKNNKKKKKNMW